MDTQKRIPVETNTPLSVSYFYDEAENLESQTSTAFVHGLCHSAKHFKKVGQEMSQRGINAARIDIQSYGNNWINFDAYVTALHDALNQIEKDTRMKIGTLCGHSMGGQMVQEFLQSHEKWHMPTVLLAPVPTQGALPALLRAVRKDRSILFKSLKNFDVSNAMRDPDDARLLFFNERTLEPIVTQAVEDIRHTSFRAYLSILTRPLIRPIIEDTGQPTLLIRGFDDFLFQKKGYNGMRRIYSKFDEKTIPGGHDFYIQHAPTTADFIEEFHQCHNSKKDSSIG